MTSEPFHVLQRTADGLRATAESKERMAGQVRRTSDVHADRMVAEASAIRARATALEAEARIACFRQALALHQSASNYKSYAKDCDDDREARRLRNISLMFTQLGNAIEQLVQAPPGGGPPSNDPYRRG